MANNSEQYKMYQVALVFVNKYGFKEILLKQYETFIKDEIWIFNYADCNYQAIRISFDTDVNNYCKQRIDTYLAFFKKDANRDINFLDIHINKNVYNLESEVYDYINIDQDYYAGINLKNVYPDIYNCIHPLDKKTLNYFNKIHNKNSSNKKIGFLEFIKHSKAQATFIICCLCVLMYLLEFALSLKYDKASTFLLLGADYKTLTLACHEYYRLITYAFLHNGLLHLVFNVISLFSIGRIIEYRYGHFKFLIILFVSIICGSLTQGILTDNDLCIGISGGIYGLFIAFVIDMVRNKLVDINRFVPVVFLNLLLNFSTTTAWTCHLGGAIGGLAAYFAIIDNKNIPAILLVLVLLSALTYRYLTISTIDTFYGGTDSNYVEMLEDLNLNSDKVALKIMNAYAKYGG